LLTQGWRRYVWSEPALKEYGNARYPVIFDGVTGAFDAIKKRKKAQTPLRFVRAFDPEKKENSNLIAADSTGVFTITSALLKTRQGDYVYLKPLIESQISITDPFQTIYQIRTTKAITYPIPNKTDTAKEQSFRPFIVGLENDIQLDEVTIKVKAINPFRDKYMGRLDSLAKLNFNNDYVGIPCNTLNCPFHTPDKSKTKKPVEGETYKILTDVDMKSMSYKREERLTYYYPKLTEEELLQMNNLWRVKAYYVQREFYQPRYDKISENYFIPDSRNTLLWTPSVITDEKGEATLEFFCSDINTEFVGKIEGASNNGLLGIQDFEFKVLKTKPFEWEK